MAAGIELQHGVGIGVADSPKLFRAQLQIIREAQGAQGIGCSGLGWQWCGKCHDAGATLDQVKTTPFPGGHARFRVDQIAQGELKQVRSIDKQRIRRRYGRVSAAELEAIDNGLVSPALSRRAQPASARDQRDR